MRQKETPKDQEKSQVETLLNSLNIDELSPKEALHLLYKMQRELKS